MAIRRTPPPAPVVSDPLMNRWMHDLTSFIATSGGVDPNSIAGYATLQGSVSNNTTQIASLQSQVNTISSSQVTDEANISALQTLTSTHTTQIAALNALGLVHFGSGAPTAGLGKQGDLYLNLTGTAGTLLYGKLTSGAWTALA